MSHGWIKLHRKLEHNWIWEDPEKLRAWIDFLFRANHKEADIAIGNTIVKVPRGSFVCSQRRLQAHFRWGRKKIEGFLSLLKQAQMCTYESTHQYTHIYITNYDSYQDNEHTQGHTEEHTQEHTDAPRTRHEGTTNKNDKESKNDKKIRTRTVAPLPELPMELLRTSCIDAWNDFIQHRKEIRKPLTPKSCTMIFNRYATDPDGFAADIRHSIEKGWAGIFKAGGTLNGNASKTSIMDSYRDILSGRV